MVIQAGTNGAISEDDLRSLLDGLRDRRRVVLLTSYGPNDWQRSSNAAIHDVAAAYPNVRWRTSPRWRPVTASTSWRMACT